MSIEAVLFDLDDTLFDRHRAQVEILRGFKERFPDIFGDLDDEAMIGAFYESDVLANDDFYAGGGLETVRAGRARHFLRLLGLDTSPAADLAKAYVEAYARVFCPVDGAPELVRRLADRMPVGIVTNGFPDVQYAKLNGLGVRDRFRCVIISDEVGFWKPDPEVFRIAATALGRSPERCLFVGNNYHDDVVGAKAAGLRACWLNPRGEPIPENGPHPDFQVKDLGELAEITGLDRRV